VMTINVGGISYPQGKALKLVQLVENEHPCLKCNHRTKRDSRCIVGTLLTDHPATF